MNPSYAFEIEKLNRIIDECDDIEVLRSRLKDMIQMHYVMKSTMTDLLKN